MTSPRPHPSGAEFGPGVHFIPAVLIPNILSIARAVPRRPSRAEPLQPPPRPAARREGAHQALCRLASTLRASLRAAGPGLGAAASGDQAMQ